MTSPDTIGALYRGAWHILRDGRRHALPAMADELGASIGDLRSVLTLAWEQGEPLDADGAIHQPDWWWWRTDVVTDGGLLGMLDHPAGRTSRECAALLDVSRSTATARLRRLIDAGLAERRAAWPAPRYHLTAAGRAALETTP